ncbi:MAG: tRNA (adenine-N1)-methyltransferase [Candidatus Hadarchaeales archaeon]
MIREGDRIVLIDVRGKKYLTRAERRKLQTSQGVVDLEAAIGAEPGARIRSHLGREFVVLPPSATDYLQKLRRVPQIMLPKDAAQIVANTGVGPGSMVVDAGAGSGALAIFIGNLVRPDGRVVSYEIREDFARVAEENVKMAGLDGVVTVKLKDIYSGIDEKDLDLVTIDLPSPELVLPHAERSLKPGGYLAVFAPCVEHLQRFYRAAADFRFTELRTIECLVRDILVTEKGTRPGSRMIAHTGYLTFARRV